jgi:lysophospholipase L1-like esterase
MLQEKYRGKYIFVNSGINGNLAYNLKQRLAADCTVYDPDIVTILIGTNDVNSRKNKKTMANYIRIQRLPQSPDRHFFKKNLTDIIRYIRKKTNAKIAILSLPVIDEDLDSQSNIYARKYSEDIREIAKKHKVSYLPLNERQTLFLSRIKGRKPLKDYSRKFFRTILLMLRRGFDRIAEINHRYLTYDGLHQTTKGAKIISSLISRFLDKHAAK